MTARRASSAVALVASASLSSFTGEGHGTDGRSPAVVITPMPLGVAGMF